jgi:3-oxoacyl-[acyl-carrier protein] reductase
LGKAIAERFAADGQAHQLFLCARTKNELEATGAALRDRFPAVNVYTRVCDVSDKDQLLEFADWVKSQCGKTDILVNNAGISKDNLLMRMSYEQWNDVIQVNLNSVFYMTKQVIRPMMKARNGVIINMSSIIGEIGNAGQASYAASKAGIIGFTKSVAKELGSRNIRCNAIAPGFVETDMTSYLKEGEAADKYKAGIPLGRFASAEDIANSCLFLASDWGSYITGQTLSVCGGLNI